ncbi:hypothetical protein VPH35_048846 [Triticum aestivum]
MKGTKSFVAVQHELNCVNIRLYKECYSSDKKGWASEDARNKHEEMLQKRNEHIKEGEVPLTEQGIWYMVTSEVGVMDGTSARRLGFPTDRSVFRSGYRSILLMVLWSQMEGRGGEAILERCRGHVGSDPSSAKLDSLQMPKVQFTQMPKE